MDKGIKITNYSDIILSCFSDDASKCDVTAKCHYITCVLSGEMEINESGKITRLHSGECAFIRKDNHVTLAKLPLKNEQFKSVTLRFQRNFLREFYRTLDKKTLPVDANRLNYSVLMLPAERPDIRSLFDSLIPYFDSSVAPSPEIVKMKMTEGIYCLLNTDKDICTALFDFSAPWKIDILDFLNTNYMHNLTTADLANYTGRSLASFKRDFKKISPLSPEKWVIEKRLKVAHDKISKENKKASDVYLELGFKSLSHFSTAFKRQYGFPPTAI
jgi:AraC-like DNA-binding protein